MSKSIIYDALACPICKKPLDNIGASFRCESEHNFDLSKNGYVNLLMSGASKQKRHGDDKLMLTSRREFLDKGYFDSFANKISSTVGKYLETKNEPDVLDVGCGEGYYIEKLISSIPEARFYGVDISKDAAVFAKKRLKDLCMVVASINKLPFKDRSIDCITNIFAPHNENEFHRVMKDDGILLRGVPKEKHLHELKEAIYDQVYPNKATVIELDGLELVERIDVDETIELNNSDDILRLFMMTPYYYKTSKADQDKLKNLDFLKTRISFEILIYKKG